MTAHCFTQGAFVCGEAGVENDELPLLVFAVSESLISWHDYAVGLPITEQLSEQTLQHYHPAVLETAVEKVAKHPHCLCNMFCRTSAQVS